MPSRHEAPSFKPVLPVMGLGERCKLPNEQGRLHHISLGTNTPSQIRGEGVSVLQGRMRWEEFDMN